MEKTSPWRHVMIWVVEIVVAIIFLGVLTVAVVYVVKRKREIENAQTHAPCPCQTKSSP